MRLFAAAFAAVAAQNAAAFSPVATSTTGRRFSTTVRMAEKTAALSQDELKKMVGYKAVDDYVKSGMVVGLGTGSTAYFAVERLGQLLASGELKDIVAIPTSVRTKEQAESLNIPLVTLDTHSKLDVAIDGADEAADDEGDVIQIEHAHQLWQSYFLLSRDCPAAVEDVPAEFRNYLEGKWNAEKSRGKQSSSRHRAISQTLSLMKVAHRNEYVEDVDVAIVLEEDSAWTHTALHDFDFEREGGERWKKVAVEFDGPHHFTVMASTGEDLSSMEGGVKITTPRVLGHTVLKYRLLKKKGWTVVRIPYYEFDKIPFWASMVS